MATAALLLRRALLSSSPTTSFSSVLARRCDRITPVRSMATASASADPFQKIQIQRDDTVSMLIYLFQFNYLFQGFIEEGFSAIFHKISFFFNA
jgi:hypothetical protein